MKFFTVLVFLFLSSCASTTRSEANLELVTKLEDNYNLSHDIKISFDENGFNPTEKFFKKYANNIDEFIYIFAWTNSNDFTYGFQFKSLLYDTKRNEKFYAYNNKRTNMKIKFGRGSEDFIEEDQVLSIFLDMGIEGLKPYQKDLRLSDTQPVSTIIVSVSKNDKQIYVLESLDMLKENEVK